MKDEIARIMKLVQEGKLSPEDAAELIDAFQGSEKAEPQAAPPPPPPSEPPADETEPEKTADPFHGVIDFIEKIGRDVTQKVDWQEISSQVKTGANKGFDALKKAAEDIKAGNLTIGLFVTNETRDIALPIASSEGKTVKIENPCGNIKVTGGHESGSINARVKVSGSNVEDAKAKADAFTLVVEESDSQILIRQPKQSNVSVDMVVQLAGKAAVDLKTDSGNIDVVDAGGSAKIVSSSGNLSISGATGTIDISAQSGDSSITDCEEANVSLESKSGHVSIKNLNGNINARCASGRLEVLAWRGRVLSVESVTGDVIVDVVNPVTGTVNIRTVNGDTELAIADGGDARVSLSTIRGTVSSSISLDDEARGDQHVTGRLGDGTGTLDVSGINGDITLKMRDSS